MKADLLAGFNRASSLMQKYAFSYRHMNISELQELQTLLTTIKTEVDKGVDFHLKEAQKQQ
jgi:hypothetical protein